VRRVLKTFKVAGRVLGILFLAPPPPEVIDSPRNATNRLNDTVAPAAAQFFDAARAAGWRHVLLGFVNAVAAFRSGRNISRELTVETLLRMSAQSQIGLALKRVGVSSTTKSLGVILVASSENELDGAVRTMLSHWGVSETEEREPPSEEELRNLIHLYSVTDAELEAMQAEDNWRALVNAILERVAVVDLYR